MKQPLVGIALVFSLGIYVASKIKFLFLPLYVITTLFLILSIIFMKKEKIFSILLFFIFFLLGSLLLINSHILTVNHILKFIHIKDRHVYIEGVVDNDPIRQSDKSVFVLKAEKLKIDNHWYKVCGKVLVKLSHQENFFYGDKLILEGRFYRPFYSRINRRLRYKDYLKRRGIYIVLIVRKNDVIKKIKSRQGNQIVYFAFKIRHRLKETVTRNLSGLSGSVLNAIILGLRTDLPPGIRDILLNTGTVHIIAISGLHLGIVAFIVLIFLKLIRVPKRPRAIITIFILFLYCILTGFNTPVIRATIMAVILLLGYMIKREVDVYNSLSLAALTILFINPWQLFEMSFQLSFLSISSIVWISPKIIFLFSDKIKSTKSANFLVHIFSVSLAAWLGTLPIIAYYFKIISPIAILANMLVVPYMTIPIIIGITFLAADFICRPWVAIFSLPAEFSLYLLLRFISWLNSIPFGHFRFS